MRTIALFASGLLAGVALLGPGSAFTDAAGVSIELMQFGPEALQRKATDAWK